MAKAQSKEDRQDAPREVVTTKKAKAASKDKSAGPPATSNSPRSYFKDIKLGGEEMVREVLLPSLSGISYLAVLGDDRRYQSFATSRG